MIYDVNTERIERQLTYLQTCIDVIARIDEQPQEKWMQDPIRVFALSRAYHIAVECIIDVGSLLIDGFIMRDPGGYLDIVDILADEEVIPAEQADTIKTLVRFRDRLARHYDTLVPADLAEHLDKREIMASFINWVRSYLTRELGESYR
ncbi:DUF86 domain-containing protein [Polycladomyces subterraneus]|uniref:DUF86 domain-containing protein n=1 Tax=Polycladomyces subterraneus TaxID=1016997 RepID=A0ABT8IRM1_9BACL|nr:DUF86 domain-containing protein [Polycladomyces subterraneus]MDN4595458.1 DUF86 domain-containing protein [Polycladomyces subterraneus]